MLHEEVTPLEPVAGVEPAPLHTLLALRQEFLRFLARRLNSPAEAEDLLQNCYVKALEHTGELEQADSVRAWFYRVLRNALVDHYRHSGAQGRAHEGWAAELELEVAPNDLADGLACQCIAHVLPSLTPSYGAILARVDLEEVRLADFAAANGITAANATVRLHRARKALKQRLVEVCGCCAAHGCVDCTCRHTKTSPVQSAV